MVTRKVVVESSVRSKLRELQCGGEESDKAAPMSASMSVVPAQNDVKAGRENAALKQYNIGVQTQLKEARVAECRLRRKVETADGQETSQTV